MRTVRWIFLLAATAVLHAAANEATTPTPKAADAPAQRASVMVVKPVILCDDDGANPARHELPKAVLDQTLAGAEAEIIFLEPVKWHHGRARRGEIGPGEIGQQGRANGMIAADSRVLTMLFVAAIQGPAGPAGRGTRGDQPCFVALGPDGPATDPADAAAMVGRALADSVLPDRATDKPADGAKPAKAAAGPDPAQIAAIRGSRLALPRFHCHSAAEARELLADESWFPFHASATPDGVRFALGLAPDARVPADPAERARFSREAHAAMALDFTAAEQAALKRAVGAIRRELGDDWPLLSRLPWHFIKVKTGFCGDLPHTRGMATVVSQSALRQMLEEPEMARFLLFHEKIHVIQRLSPEVFAALYQTYGYQPIRLAPGEAARLNLLVNPDAPVHDHAIAVDGRTVLIAAAFVPQGRRIAFAENYFLLKPGGSGFIIEREFPAAPVEQWLERFPIRAGYDHPHENFAYLCNILVDLRKRKDLATAREHPMLRATLDALPEIFRLAGE